MDCLLTLWPILIPCSLGNGCCMFGFLIFIIAKEISCTTAYIYSQKDHQSTFAPSELGFPCVSFFHFLPLSLQLILWSIETCRAHSPALASKTPLERAPCAFVSNESPVSRSLLVLCINQGISASFSLSFSAGSGPLKDPNSHLLQMADTGKKGCLATWGVLHEKYTLLSLAAKILRFTYKCSTTSFTG